MTSREKQVSARFGAVIPAGQGLRQAQLAGQARGVGPGDVLTALCARHEIVDSEHVFQPGGIEHLERPLLQGGGIGLSHAGIGPFG